MEPVDPEAIKAILQPLRPAVVEQLDKKGCLKGDVRLLEHSMVGVICKGSFAV